MSVGFRPYVRPPANAPPIPSVPYNKYYLSDMVPGKRAALTGAMGKQDTGLSTADLDALLGLGGVAFNAAASRPPATGAGPAHKKNKPGFTSPAPTRDQINPPPPPSLMNRSLVDRQKLLVDGPSDKCQHCNAADHEDQMLLCDGCSSGFHIYCLDPPLKEIPEGDWYCQKCIQFGANNLILDDHAAQTIFRRWYDTESVFRGQWKMFACEPSRTSSRRVWRMQYTTEPHSGGPHCCRVEFRTQRVNGQWKWQVESCDLEHSPDLRSERKRKIFYDYKARHIVAGPDGTARAVPNGEPTASVSETGSVKMCEDCKIKRPSYGFKTDLKKRWCAGCGKNHPGSEQLQKEKMCEDCATKRPSYGMRKEGKKRWCAGCGKRKHPGAERLQKMCEDCDVKVPSYGCRENKMRFGSSPDSMRPGKMRWCGDCATRHPEAEYMLNLKQICEDCEVKRAHYGMPRENKRRWCAGCGKRVRFHIIGNMRI